MKKLLLLLAPLTLGLMVGCSYDDSAILDKITELEKEQDEMQAQIDAQQALLDALANNLTITAVTQNDNGYTITFSDGSSMTIKNGEQGEKGDKGDNGEKGEQGDSFIESIVVGEEDVTFTLTDGTVIVIPLGSDSGDTSSEDNKIYYTTSDNTKLFPKTDADLYGAILISNTYKDGQGVLVFDDAITSIGNYAFQNCSSLTSITIPNSVTSIGKSAFENCTGELILNCSCLGLYGGQFTKLVIGNGVTSIGERAFDGCSSLTSVTIPDSVTSIGYCTFQNCTSLTSITIPDSVTSIGEWAFRGCSSLTSITIPDSVTSIGNSAFRGCTSLTSVTIPDSVTSIGESAFYYCTSLTEVYCKPVTPPSGGSNMFGGNASGRKFYVPTESVESYKTAYRWKDYASSIVGYDFE